MAEWTLEDAPEYFRAQATDDVGSALWWLFHGLQWLHLDDFEQLKYGIKNAELYAESAEEWATRYRDAKRAVSELRNTLHDFEHFCRDLCGKSPVYHTFEHVMQDHADMLSEIDWEDDDVCF